MHLIYLFLIFSLSASPAIAAEKTRITLFLDGARVEREVVVAKGYLEVPLPSGMQAGSLRVKPLGKGSISRVELVPAVPGRMAEKELARLQERREALGDRLRAIGVKEEVFTAAARTQSGKAPRKTKANPEPLAAIRQGTDFAVARLEEVFSARRKAERELKDVDEQLAVVRKRAGGGGTVARIWFSGKDGRAQLSYVNGELRWKPFYDFRLAGDGKAELSIHALLSAGEKEARYDVVFGFIADTTASVAAVPLKDDFDTVLRISLPVSGEQYSRYPNSALTFTFANNSGRHLPGGEMVAFWLGEYIGKASFASCKLGEIQTLSFGATMP
jgi:hypothetical protein